MKHKVTLFAVLLMVLAIPQSVKAYSFSAVAPSGQTLYYSVTQGNAWVTYSSSVFGQNYSDLVGDVVIPSTVTNEFGTTFCVVGINNHAFLGCQGITSVYIPNSVGIGGISNEAFSNCENLETVIMEDSVKFTGQYCFQNCEKLISVTLPSLLTSIPSGCFLNCWSLTTLTIPNSVTSIGDFAFDGCVSLTTVNIPNTVTTIGEYAFCVCPLLSVTIPNTISFVGEWAFSGTANINYHGNMNTEDWGAISINGFFDGDFVYTDSTRTQLAVYVGSNPVVDIPNWVTTIGRWAFLYRPSILTSVTIPDGVTSIGQAAFGSCYGLTSITIPSSVTSIGIGAFSDCVGLTSITVMSTTPPALGAYAFDSTYWIGDNDYYSLIDVPVHVPVGTVPLYRADTAWGAFSIITDGIVSDTVNHPNSNDTTVVVNDTIIYQLPYSADFSQGWTATGSSYVTADSAVLVGIDDTIYSPWFTASDASVVFMTFAFSSNNENYGYASLDILDEQGNLVCDAWLDANYTSMSYWPGFPACGLTNTNFRLALHWSPYGNFQGKTFSLHEMYIYQYDIRLGIAGPDTLDPGQSGVFTVSLLDGTEADTIYFDSDESNGYSSVANGNTLTVTGNAPGNYYVIAYANKRNVYNGWPAHTTIWKEFVVRDTTTYLCPDVVDTLPFEADFSQCWTLIGGAELTEDGYIKLSGQGQRAVGPWVDIDTAGNLIIIATSNRDNPDALPSDTNLGNNVTTLGKIQIRDSSYGTFYIDASRPVNNGSWNASNYYNGQQVRLEYEYYSGDEPVYITSSALYQIDVLPTAEVVLNGTAYEGMPYTFDVNYALGGDNVPDSIVWTFSDGTVVSGEGTTTPTVVFNSIGYEYCTVRLYRRIFGNHMVSAYAYVYLNVVADTVMHECTVDRYETPYLSHFTTCWTTSGNASIINSAEARMTSVGDTLHSPWIHINSDTVKLAYSFTSDRIPLDETSYTYSNIHCHLNVVDSNGSIVYSWNPSYGNWGGASLNQTLYGLAGHTVRVDFIYHNADTNDFILLKMALFEFEPMPEVVISGPDTVAMGQSATYTVNAPDGVFLYWYDGDGNYSYSSTFTTSWGSPGVNHINLTITQQAFGGFDINYHYAKNVVVLPSDSLLAQTLELPYSANFAEGWTLTGGATLTEDGRIRLDSTGQKAIGPWLHVGTDGETHWQYTLDPENGNNEAVHYILSRTFYNGRTATEGNWYVANQTQNVRYGYGTSDNGEIFRFELEYTEENSTTPIYLSAIDYIQTVCDMEIFGPDTVYVGQIAHYTSSTGIVHHATATEPATEPSTPSYFWKSNVNEYDFNYIESRNRDSIDVYWNEPGEYRLYLEKVYFNYYNGLNVGHKSNVKTIVVIDEPESEPTFCDTTVYTLPYYADFTQCWQAIDGAEIANGDTVLFSNHLQSIISPTIHADSNTYIHFSFDSTNLHHSNNNIWVRIYSEDSETPILSVSRGQDVNENGVHLKVPASGNFRVILTQSTSNWSNIEFRIAKFWADSYPWSVEMQVPDTIYSYERTTLTASASLPDDSEEITYSWSISDSYYNGDTITYTLNGGYYNFVGSTTVMLHAYSKKHGDITVRKYPVYLASRPCLHDTISQFPYSLGFEHGFDCWHTAHINSYHGSIVVTGGAHGGYNFYEMKRYNATVEGPFTSPILALNEGRYIIDFYARQWDGCSAVVYFGRETDTSTITIPLTEEWTRHELLLPEETRWVGFDGKYTYSYSVLQLDDITISAIGGFADSTMTLVDTIFHDTVVYNITYQDSVVYNISVQDSLQLNITVQDSIAWNIIHSDSVVYYYDTTCAIHDTLTLTEYVPVHDTTYIEMPVHDTAYVAVHDTAFINIPVHDTTFIDVHDTLYLTLYDTIYDTIYITDTVFIGIDDVEAISARIYTSKGQIVVDGADGNTVWLYDVNGRLLATKQDDYIPLRFDAPASGTYMIKIGNYPARKVVVIR